ncbi:hypothetical protein Zm00014a_004513 [Zea mays]|uniref:ACT domain-containing protein n=1 Tax=Zea mays TaxID=4577 RepID=A0A3L6FNY2_MAIZE|nr:hypothetical protein Zm00014a_004513 [Zea mays]
MQGLAVSCQLPPAAAAARWRPRASSSNREAVLQCWKYELSQDHYLGGPLRIGQSQGSLHRHRSTNFLRPAAAAISVEQDEVNTYLPKGDMWSVHKFGGTCMGTPKRIQCVANIVLGDSSERKLIIVSAMSKVTDMMYNLVQKAQSRDDSYAIALAEVFEKHMTAAKDLLDGEDLARFLSQLHSDVSNLRAMLRAIYIAGHATESFSDFVVGHGELWSAQMLSYAIKKSGAPCSWMDTREVLVVTPSGCNQVDPDYLECEKRLQKWFSRQPAEIIVATGFIASTAGNIPTTLKRDGSDFSAAIVGSLVRARQVTIWTDVDGVFSADPRKVSEAVILSTLSYQEAWEMRAGRAQALGELGTAVNVADELARGLDRARTEQTQARQQADLAELQHEELRRGGAAQAKAGLGATMDRSSLEKDTRAPRPRRTGMAGVPGTASAIFSAVKDVGANVIMISQASSEHSVCFAVPEKEVAVVSAELHDRFREALAAGRLSKVEVINGCSILAAVGLRMASTPGVSAILFDALAKANINVRAIAQGCSEYNITVVLKQQDCVRALRAAHSRFFLSKTTLAVGIIGPGLIGGALLNQLKNQTAVLKENMNIDLRVIGITGSSTMLLSDTGIDLTQWKQLLQKEAEPADIGSFVHHLSDNHVFPNKVLVDCTADTSVASHYYDWLKKGIHVITPNKKANSGPLDQYHLLMADTEFCSGTLSYIFNNFEGTRAFSDVVAEAREAGYTEPDPRDDLSGTDVARKVVVLARESGLRLELSDIPVKSLVPETLAQSCSSADEFMQKLPSFDEDWARQRSDAEAAGEVLRYVGALDAVNRSGQVELRRYRRDHPFAQLSGSDNIIAFTTSRYKEQPLIVRGPGAGAEVTAGGVFCDILRLASYLGAPS